MSTDYYQQQPVPPPARRSGCLRRGCILGCVVVLVLCVVLAGATIAGVFALGRYITSMRLETAPCPLMNIGIEVMERGIENPGPNTTPEDLAKMRQAQAALQAEYNRRCTSSTRA